MSFSCRQILYVPVSSLSDYVCPRFLAVRFCMAPFYLLQFLYVPVFWPSDSVWPRFLSVKLCMSPFSGRQILYVPVFSPSDYVCPRFLSVRLCMSPFSLRQILYAKSVDQRSQTFERSLAVGKEYIKQTKGLILRAAIQASQIAVRVSTRPGSNPSNDKTFYPMFVNISSDLLPSIISFILKTNAMNYPFAWGSMSGDQFEFAYPNHFHAHFC